MADTWRLLRDEPIANDFHLQVRRSTFELPNGDRLDDFITLAEDDSVHVVAITPNHETVLVRQYRYGVDAWTYEVPAGFVEADDREPLERAQRELREETGFEAEEWIALGNAQPLINRMRTTEHCFLALGARRVSEQQLDEGEAATWQLVTLDQLRDMIATSQITSASALAAVCKALVALQARQDA